MADKKITKAQAKDAGKKMHDSKESTRDKASKDLNTWKKQSK